MARQVVQMDYTVIERVSKGLAQDRQTLTMVGKVLEAALVALRANFIVALLTGRALENYLENLMKRVNELSALCGEFSLDLERAIGDHKRGDYEGKRYFGEGVG